MHRGYIKLWRKVFESNVWKNKNLWRFWTWCLLKGSHKIHKIMVGYQEIELKPGQFIFGRKKCAEETGLSEQNIRTCLRILNDTELTIKPTNKFSIGTIINWKDYQISQNETNQQVTIKQPASNQQVTTNKNVNNEKNVNKKKYSEQFLKFYSAYPLKKSKAKAFEAWEKHRPDIGVCLAAIQSQEIEKSFLKAEGQFCPEWKYPATWINQQCWEDETEKKPKKIKEYISMPNECKAGPCMNKVDDSKDYCESCQEVLDEAGCKTYDDWQRSGIGQRNLGKILGAIGTKI